MHIAIGVPEIAIVVLLAAGAVFVALRRGGLAHAASLLSILFAMVLFVVGLFVLTNQPAGHYRSTQTMIGGLMLIIAVATPFVLMAMNRRRRDVVTDGKAPSID